MFLRESKYSVSLITVPFCPVAPCPFQILAGVLHCAYFCCCTCFGIKKKYNVSSRFSQIHQFFHKILSINIILKSIKGNNSVEKFGKIICIIHNMDHIYQRINNFIKIHSLFLRILRKIEMLTSIKNSVEKFGKVSCISHNTAYTKFHQNPSICSQDIK